MIQLGAPSVIAGISSAVDLTNPATLRSLLWLVLTPLAVAVWTIPSLPTRLGKSLVLSIVAADLLTFAGAFYPQSRGVDLQVTHPAIQALRSRQGTNHVLVDPGLYHLIGANQLVSAGLDAAGGYSSLEPTRFLDYWWSMIRDENVLMDLFNVRYAVVPRQQPGSLVFNDTRFHPAERLVFGGPQNPAVPSPFAETMSMLIVSRLSVPWMA
jgi:hypothetical protein